MMLSKWKGCSSSLSVGDEARRPPLPVRDLPFVKEIYSLPLGTYCSERLHLRRAALVDFFLTLSKVSKVLVSGKNRD
jgi:hypothetical protein